MLDDNAVVYWLRCVVSRDVMMGIVEVRVKYPELVVTDVGDPVNG